MTEKITSTEAMGYISRFADFEDRRLSFTHRSGVAKTPLYH
jgi:hypothetical protein